MSCGRARCDDPNCLVCSTIERGFPRAVFQEFTGRRRGKPEEPEAMDAAPGLFDTSTKQESQ